MQKGVSSQVSFILIVALILATTFVFSYFQSGTGHIVRAQLSSPSQIIDESTEDQDFSANFNLQSSNFQSPSLSARNNGVPIPYKPDLHLAYVTSGPNFTPPTKIRHIILGPNYPPTVIDEITPTGIFVFNAALDSRNNYAIVYAEGSSFGMNINYRINKVTETIATSSAYIGHVALQFDTNNNPYIITKERGNPTPFVLYKKTSGVWQSYKLSLQAEDFVMDPFAMILNRNSGNIYLFYTKGSGKSPRTVYEALISSSGAILSDTLISGQIVVEAEPRIAGFVDIMNNRDVLFSSTNWQTSNVYLASSSANWAPRFIFSRNTVDFLHRNIDLTVNQFGGRRSDILIPGLLRDNLELFKSTNGINFVSQNILTKPSNLDARGIKIAKEINSPSLYITYSLNDKPLITFTDLYVAYVDNYLAPNPVVKSLLIDNFVFSDAYTVFMAVEK